jgi:hypothetical protein
MKKIYIFKHKEESMLDRKGLLSGQFNRKTLEPSHIVEDVLALFKNFPSFAQSYFTHKINRDFIRKLMILVSEVNGCSYCSWFHTQMALFLGSIDPYVIENILSTEIGQKVSEYELVGLAYAQHYAATNKNPDPEATIILHEYYGKEKAECIKTCIDIIYTFNLAGNTFDAFLSRLKGQRAQYNNFWFEFIFFILSAPFLAPIIPLVRIHKTKKYSHS